MKGAEMQPMLLLAVAVAAALLAWFVAEIGSGALSRYRANFTERTRFQAQEFFLFVDPGTCSWSISP
jgi:tight adherence protein B